MPTLLIKETLKLKTIEYITNNKDWIFSGIGVTVLTLLISFLIYIFRKKKNTPKDINQKAKLFVFGCNNKSKINQKNDK